MLDEAEGNGDILVQGVMLTHANMFYQIQNLNHYIHPDVGDTSLSLLPPWHIYERACGYYLYYCGCCQVRKMHLFMLIGADFPGKVAGISNSI